MSVFISISSVYYVYPKDTKQYSHLSNCFEIYLSGWPANWSQPGDIVEFCCCNNTGVAGALNSKAFCKKAKQKKMKENINDLNYISQN